MKTRVVLCVVLAFLLSSCGSTARTGSHDPSADPASTTSSTPATDSDAVILQVITLGGYTTPEWQVATVPTIVVLADGTVYVAGAVADIYPGPLLTPLTTGRLSPGQLRELISRAKHDGLAGREPDYVVDEPSVTDMGTTEVTLDIDGATRRHQAYALGLGDERGPRKVLADFVRFAEGSAMPVASSNVEPSEVVVTSYRVRKGDSLDVKPTKQPWPVGAGSLKDGKCQLVDDPAAIAALVEGNQLSYFTSGGKTFQLGARISVPGDRGCPAE